MAPSIQLSPNSVIQRKNEKFLANSLGDETVMMNMDNGDYLGINSVGTDVWNLLSEPLTINQLIKKILELYNVSEPQCTAEVNAFLAKMQEQDMLMVTPIPG